MKKRKLSNKDVLTIVALCIVVAIIVTLVALNWDTCEKLLDSMLNGTEIAKDFVQSLHFWGMLMLAIGIMLCFFVPILPEWILPIAAGVAYGVVFGTIFAVVSFWLASQILWLFRKNLIIILGKKAEENANTMKTQIQNSKLGIHRALIIAYCVPFFPYLLISSFAMEGLDYKHYVIYTFVGPICSTLITVLFGKTMLTTSPVLSAITMILLMCLIVLAFVFKQRILNFLFRPQTTKTPENEQKTDLT